MSYSISYNIPEQSGLREATLPELEPSNEDGAML